jgi:hypothetical protein
MPDPFIPGIRDRNKTVFDTHKKYLPKDGKPVTM